MGISWYFENQKADGRDATFMGLSPYVRYVNSTYIDLQRPFLLGILY